MAEIRLSGKDLAKLEKLQGEVGKAVKGLDAVALERVSRELAGKINTVVRGLIREIDQVATNLGLEGESKTTLKRGLEGVEQASTNVQELAPLLAALPLPPQYRLAILGGAALVGGVAGYNRELARRRAVAASEKDEELLLETIRRRDEDQDAIARYASARRRARSFR